MFMMLKTRKMTVLIVAFPVNKAGDYGNIYNDDDSDSFE